jgi:hypothetical protein
MLSPVLEDLGDHKLPAILRSKDLEGPPDGSPRILSFAGNGFSKPLKVAAESDSPIDLIDVEQSVDGLTAKQGEVVLWDYHRSVCR